MKKLFLSLLLVCAFINGEAQISGKCIRVVDGDTYLFVTSKNDTLRIRDAFINTPEPKNSACAVAQPYSAESSQIAREALLNNTFRIKVFSVDSYNRTLAYAILPNGQFYHTMMLENGHAWSYRQKGKHFQMQLKAKSKGIGLWQNKNAVNPSEWLRMHSTHKK